jgi:hypothetical protein
MAATLAAAVLLPSAALAAGAAPTPADDYPTVDEDGSLTYNVLANDTDPEGDALHVSSVSPFDPATGSGSWQLNGTLHFTPKANFNGDVTLWYYASDGTSTAKAFVYITVNPVEDPPVAANDTVTVVEDTATDVTAAILANDADPDAGDTLEITAADNATGGSVDLTGGVVTFTPTADLCGAAAGSFDYTISDGDQTDDAHVTVDITCVADYPPVAVDDTVTVVEDTATDVTAAILANDTDADLYETLSVSAVDNPTGGSVVLTGGVVTFTPTANLCGAAAGSFAYTVTDGTFTDDGAVTVDITCVNDPPVAVDDTANGTEDEDVVIPEADLLANDSDVEGSDLSIVSVGNATHGSVSTDGTDVTFVPAADYCGDATFDYEVTDGNLTDTATVTITLACVNDPPVAVDDTATVGQGSAAADYDVVANDIDVDGDSLTVSDPVVDPAAGVVSVVSNKIRYAPDPAFTGDAVITYTVSDGVESDTGTLTVTVVPDAVAPVVEAPGVAFGSGRVNESAPLLISWSATDAETGIKSYEVQVKVGTGTWATIYTGTDTSITGFYPFGTSLQWQVRATDNADNVSGWEMSPVRKLVAYQGGKPAVRTGTWVTVKSTGSSGNNYRYTTTAGKRITLTFTGIGVLYVAPKLTTGGYAKVKIGASVSSVRLKASATKLGVIMASAMWGTPGQHTIKVINKQGGKRTTFDAFIVLK